ncbi:MAG: prepilin-type N-terminal cleavage/methylation domain-containing protein [Desulfobacteraceae bacterium]|jgi:general secretion pathway protein I|nr:MAG: prepilin-type N-terminal cleavage/methylation domain-containing protein [Desulfobacteraceae bacterium]
MKVVWKLKQILSKGFTLLEVMVAVAIIAIALTAVMGVQSQAVDLASEARFMTTAALLAQAKLSEIEAMGTDGTKAVSGDFGEEFPGYTWNASIDDAGAGLPIEGSYHLKRVDLSVACCGEGQYRYALRAYLFNPETR